MKEYIVSEDSYEYEMRRYDELKELIRCKECSWHYGTICRRNSTFPWEDDDYCSKGSRKEE